MAKNLDDVESRLFEINQRLMRIERRLAPWDIVCYVAFGIIFAAVLIASAWYFAAPYIPPRSPG